MTSAARNETSGLFPKVGRLPRILLVDDDPNIRRALKRQLATRGYDVVEADCGTGGILAILEQGPFDAVVSDVDMPRGCGVAMLYRLRGLNNPHADRFVFHSARWYDLACHRVPVVKKKGCVASIEEALAQL